MIGSVGQIELEGIVLDVVRKRVRYLRVSVCPPSGRVRLTVPLRMSAGFARAFAASKLDWIRRQQQKLRERPRSVAPQYVDGERHDVFGQSYALKVIHENGPPAVQMAGNELTLRVRPDTSAAGREAVVTRWHARLLETALPPLIARWEPVLRVEVGRASVRRMKTRWGSCTPRSRHLRFSTELAKCPPACLEYVVVHEMVHLLEHSHNRRFVGFMDRFLPDWRALRLELNRGSGARAPD